MPRSRYDNRIDENLYLVALPSIIPRAHRVASEGARRRNDLYRPLKRRPVRRELPVYKSRNGLTHIDRRRRSATEAIEYLEEQYPERPLLPKDAHARAHVRALAQVVAVDAHPFVVPRVRKYLERELGLDEATRMRWLQHWLDSATHTIEDMLSRDPRTGRFCCGDAPTIADICLIPHLTSAKMLYGCDLEPYPIVRQIFDTCMQIDAFALAHPLQQPDAPGLC